MVFKDLPVGATFYFGFLPIYQYDYRQQKQVETGRKAISWKKTAENELSLCTTSGINAPFDTGRPGTGSNRQIRSHGHRFFPLSVLNKYLNCADSSWRTVADGDIAPQTGAMPSGFLSVFSDQEKTYLQKFTMNITVPNGYTRLYGSTAEHEVYVGIPSSAQLGEDRQLGTFGISHSVYTWLSDSDTLFKQYRGSYCSRSSYGNTRDLVAPVIRIKDDAPIDVDEDGKYYIRIQERSFDGDLMSFLHVEFEQAA